MKKLFVILTNKILVTLFFFIIQITFSVLLLTRLYKTSYFIYLGFSVMSIILCLFIIGKDENPSYKLALVVPLLIFPLFGGLMYISFGRTAGIKKRTVRKNKEAEKATELFYADANKNALATADNIQQNAKSISSLIANKTGFPVYSNTKVTYYPLGELFVDALKQDLKAAKRFIFLEYFIISPGKCFDEIFDILKIKVAEGVDVRIIYDDLGCLFTLSGKYRDMLQRAGIKTHAFNKITPSLNIRMNDRTHRKIAVIDGETAYTGGVNLADEYVNAVNKLGHWKDTAVRLNGEAANSFTLMFLRFWSYLECERADISAYINHYTPAMHAGHVQPVCSNPSKNVRIIEKGLIQMIFNAKNYVYFNTPYLVPDNEFISALCIAAESGVDVRITLPGIPDKKSIYITSRSFYPVLLKSGVKIYEYSPGFLHAKSAVSDGNVAFVGTSNLDYRSFYLHYECGVFLYGPTAIKDIERDYLSTLESCREITYDNAVKVKAVTRLLRAALRLFAPLM